MDRIKGGLLFWVLLVLSVALPASATTFVKKFIHQAKVTTAVRNVGGSGQIATVTTQNSTTRTITFAFNQQTRSINQPNHAVTRVTASKDDGAWEIVLCDSTNGDTPDDDCTYDDSDSPLGHGNLDLEGAIVPSASGVSNFEFFNALDNQHLVLKFNDGAAGTGIYQDAFSSISIQ